LLLFVAALGVRLAFCALEPPTRLVGDERTWVALAGQLSAPDVRFDPLRFDLVFYPPLHPYLVAACSALPGGRTTVKVAQSLLGALLVLPVFAIGRRAFDRRVGLTAAAIAAFFPELVWQSVHFWSEPLFMALLWTAVALLLAADASQRPGGAALAGVLLGLASLTRDPALYFAPIAVAWLLVRRPDRSWRPAIAFAAALVLTVVPWTVRNWARYDTFIPVSLMGARTFWEANAGQHTEVIGQYTGIDQAEGPVAAYRHAWREGLAAVRSRQPWWLFEQVGRQVPRFWTAVSMPVIHVERQAYGATSPALAWTILLVTALPHVLVTGVFLVGLATLTLSRPRGLLLLFLAYYQLLHVVTLGHPRLRLPALPAVFVFAAAAAWSAHDGTLPWTPFRRAIAALLLLAFGLCLTLDLAGLRLEPAFRLS
jgi:4-amino-4-deoxy-L-arabinose transferase-like glycosyltransferase